MAALPIFKTDNKDMMLLQTKWAAELNAVLKNPITNPILLKDVSLTTGTNVINHRLGQTLQGWFITDIDGTAAIYRSAPKNNLTLTLISSANVTVDLAVF